jgi:hypothetical protein
LNNNAKSRGQVSPLGINGGIVLFQSIVLGMNFKGRKGGEEKSAD